MVGNSTNFIEELVHQNTINDYRFVKNCSFMCSQDNNFIPCNELNNIHNCEYYAYFYPVTYYVCIAMYIRTYIKDKGLYND